MTLIEQNEKLAKFMDVKLHDGRAVFDLTFNDPPEDLQYDSSWDWLMPVVEKLDLIDGYTCISIDHDCVFLHRKGGEMLNFYNKEEGSKIAAVYKAVCAGVEWIQFERLDKTAKSL